MTFTGAMLAYAFYYVCKQTDTGEPLGKKNRLDDQRIEPDDRFAS